MNQNLPSASYWGIIKLATPLILSMSGVMLMQFIDAIFLSWYSADAIAAVVPAGMAAMLLSSAFSGTAGYTSTFVAQYVGARRPEQVAAVVWQGIYFSIGSGIVLALFAFSANPIFSWVGHADAIRIMEVRFFSISCWGAFFFVAASALTGFFSGRGETRVVMIVNVVGLFVNAILDYTLIFGKFGFPRLGITGAALATVGAQALVALIFGILFLRRHNRAEWRTWRERAFNAVLLKRLVFFGFPGGIRFTVEITAWTVFVFFIGRIGPIDLAATNIAWRINGIAFFPVIGLAQAVAILVGNAQGAGRPDISFKATMRGTLISQGWMVIMATIFIVFPQQLFGIFVTADAVPQESLLQFAHIGEVLLRFVALYCLLDACNYVFVNALVAAGDTRWTLWASVILNVVFVAALLAADVWARTLMTEWTIATVFVMLQALIWFARFLQGKWKTLQVIEPAVEE
jgi:multidrug resistance protein, MATE family